VIEIGKVKLFTIDEVSKKFRVTGHTIRTYVRDGRLAGQKVGRSWYISETAIEDFFRSPYVKPKRGRPKK
jgi:excisionase family DNA binding protein